MTSGKQKRATLKAKRAERDAKIASRVQNDLGAFRRAVGVPSGAVPCNPSLLAPDSSYGSPDYAERGYYLDALFECAGCRKIEVWTATQQKWWYEIAKGGVWTKATRCRPCRRKERERVNEARNRSADGREKRAALKAAGKWRSGL